MKQYAHSGFACVKFSSFFFVPTYCLYMQYVYKLSEPQCACRQGPFAHSLVISSLTLFVAARALRIQGHARLALCTCLLGITSVLYHATHKANQKNLWRVADVLMCYLIGAHITFHTLSRFRCTSTYVAAVAVLACAGILAARPQYSLHIHASIHVLSSLGLVLLAMC